MQKSIVLSEIKDVLRFVKLFCERLLGA